LAIRSASANAPKEELMGILSWIIFGLIAGILAKFFMPGKDLVVSSLPF
jgi:hypothetical protein